MFYTMIHLNWNFDWNLPENTKNLKIGPLGISIITIVRKIELVAVQFNCLNLPSLT